MMPKPSVAIARSSPESLKTGRPTRKAETAPASTAAATESQPFQP